MFAVVKLAAVAAANRRTEIYRVTDSGLLECRSLVGVEWSPWSRAPFEHEAVGVAALSGWPEQIEVFVLDCRGGVWNRWWWHERGWLPEQGFNPLGRPFSRGTARGFSAINSGDGHFNVFVELDDGRSAMLPHVAGPDGPYWRRCKEPGALGDGWWPAYSRGPIGVYRSS
jgi:hypothetical protein